MRDLGWSNIRARGLNPGSYRDRVRGYAREVPTNSPRDDTSIITMQESSMHERRESIMNVKKRSTTAIWILPSLRRPRP